MGAIIILVLLIAIIFLAAIYNARQRRIPTMSWCEPTIRNWDDIARPVEICSVHWNGSEVAWHKNEKGEIVCEIQRGRE